MNRKLVEEYATLETARAGIATLGTKRHEIPGFMAAVNSGEDLDVLLGGPIATREFSGVVIPLHSAQSVMLHARRRDLQHRLVVAGERWADLKQRAMVLVDPVSEIFYLTRLTLRRQVAGLPEAPARFFSRLYKATTDTHAGVWSRAVGDASYIMAVDWVARYQLSLGVEVVLPLTPFVDGQTPATLNLAVQTNDLAADYLQAMNAVFGLYFSLNYPLFRRDEYVSGLIAAIRRLVEEKAPHLIAIRLRGLPSAERDDDDPLWATLRGFLIAAGGVASEFGVPLLLLNSGTYGYAALSDGIDFFSEPMNGNLGDPVEKDPLTGKSSFNPKFAAGKAYHSEHKINLLKRDFEHTVIAEGGYPEVPHSTAPRVGATDKEFRRQAKHYRVAARCEEARKFKAAIMNGEERALAEEFARSRARNAERLLQSPM